MDSNKEYMVQKIKNWLAVESKINELKPKGYTLIAQSNKSDIVIVEDNIYFLQNDVKMEYLKDSDLITECYWKGTCNYYHLQINEELHENIGWHYDNPFEQAKTIEKRVAFYTGWSRPSVKIKLFEITK